MEAVHEVSRILKLNYLWIIIDFSPPKNSVGCRGYRYYFPLASVDLQCGFLF